MDDGELRARVVRSLGRGQEIFGQHADGGQVVRGDGYVASVVPAVPDASLPNACVLHEPAALTFDVLHLLRDAYADAGVRKWGVWLDPADADALGTAGAAGLVFDSRPLRMGAGLDEVTLGDPPPAAPIDLATVGRVNALAYGHADDRLERMIAGLPADAVRTYGAFGEDGEATSAVVAIDHEGDAGVLMVATAPWAQHQGLARRLMQRALVDARERGCTSTTLIASSLGAPVYTGMGYRPLGELQLWEHRS